MTVPDISVRPGRSVCLFVCVRNADNAESHIAYSATSFAGNADTYGMTVSVREFHPGNGANTHLIMNAVN